MPARQGNVYLHKNKLADKTKSSIYTEKVDNEMGKMKPAGNN